MRLTDVIKFHKTLALAASASNHHEAAAAELAARRIAKACNLDPTRIPDQSFVSDVNFADNALLKKLRDEWREAHPQAVNTKKAKHKPKAKPAPVNTSKPVPTDDADSPFADLSFEDFGKHPVDTSKPDRNRDCHAPGYMKNYMRKQRAKKRR